MKSQNIEFSGSAYRGNRTYNAVRLVGAIDTKEVPVTVAQSDPPVVAYA